MFFFLKHMGKYVQSIEFKPFSERKYTLHTDICRDLSEECNSSEKKVVNFAWKHDKYTVKWLFGPNEF